MQKRMEQERMTGEEDRTEEDLSGLDEWFMVHYLYLIGETDYAAIQDSILHRKMDANADGYSYWTGLLGSPMCGRIMDISRLEHMVDQKPAVEG